MNGKSGVINAVEVEERTAAGWQNPVAGGYVSSSFGERVSPIKNRPEFHNGIDIAVGTGTPAEAIDGGAVLATGNSPSWGKYVRYRVGSGHEVFYAHLSEILVSEGQQVAQGEMLAKTGSTGYSTGPHLHVTIYEAGKEIDPLPFFEYKTSDRTKAEYIARGETPPEQ